MVAVDARYRAWDGTQDPLAEPVDVGRVLDELSGDLLNGFGGRDGLRQMLRRGIQGRVGLDDIRDRLREQREAMRSQMHAASPLDGLTEELDDIVATERAELAGRDDTDARFNELALDSMPRDAAGRFQALRGYDFASEEARQRFEQLEEQLRRDLLDAYFRQLSDGMRSVTPDDIARYGEMLAELNEMIAARERGEDHDFDGFMERYGDLFPENPQDLDELLETLAQRMAAMSRLMASLSPEQRAQLQALAEELFDDLDMQFQLSQLSENLRQLAPHLPWDQGGMDGYGLGEGDPIGFSDLLDQVERLQELEDLEEALAGEYAGATLDDIDEEALRRNLGADAVRDLRQLKEIERELERSGALQRRDGELELTPRGARLLGERALTALLERIERRPSTRHHGADPEPTGQTRQWRFGDREPIAVRKTVTNAVLRGAAQGRKAGSVEIAPDDFEVAETEVRPRTATALLLDLSFSMPLQGHFVPAKRMALALNALIEGKHRQDSLHLIGFSDYARRMQPADLGAAGFERVYGTNMQHAFLLARRVLADDPRPVKQVIMVTDGEPTAHLDHGQAIFHWPPVRETLEKTLREAARLARSGISLNIFLLEDAPGLVSFAHRLADLTDGQVFQMQGDELGRFVLRDYVARHGDGVVG
ncbi:MAG: hypothetical protein R3320_10980 [Nitriliruptorales bacterium]|nr:hypothetical protein [Nitriliruptorales bacterium]